MFELTPNSCGPFRPPVIPPAPERETPADRAQPVKPKAKRKRKVVTFLREEEIERLFSVIDGTRDRAIFRLAYHAGLRASEVGMLELRDYDPKTDRILPTGSRVPIPAITT